LSRHGLPAVVINDQSTTQKGTAFLVSESDATTSALEIDAICRLEDPNEGQDREGEGGPVNEGRRARMIEDGPQGPGDDESARKVSLEGGERVSGRGALQEEESEEHKDLGPNPSVMLSRIDTERLKCGHKDKNGGPPMPHGERQVHEQLIADGLGGVILLDAVVDVTNGRGDQKGKDESGNVVVLGPNGDKDGVEDGEEREPPGDSVDHDGLGVGGGELINDGAEEEKVNDRPSEEGPIGRSEVRLLDVSVDGMWGGYGIDV